MNTNEAELFLNAKIKTFIKNYNDLNLKMATDISVNISMDI